MFRGPGGMHITRAHALLERRADACKHLCVGGGNWRECTGLQLRSQVFFPIAKSFWGLASPSSS